LKKNKKLQNELMAEKNTFESIMNAIPDFIFCKDLNRNYTRFNKRFLDFFDITSEQVRGKGDAEGLKMPSDIVHDYREQDMKVLSQGLSYTVEEEVQGADGKRILCETIKVPMIENGKVVGLTAISRDITQRKRVEEKAEHEAATLKAIFDAIPDFIFCKDLNLKYTRCNKHMEDFFGVLEADLIGKDDADGLGAPSDMVRKCNESDMVILQTGESTVAEEIVPGANGTRKLCETIKVPIIKNGAIVGLTGIARDVTERKAHEEATHAASKAKSEFMSRMSHEMLTPMNAIMGLAQVLKIQDKTDGIKEYVDEIYIAAHDLLRLITDVLDMSSMEFGIFKLEYSAFSFSEMFDDILKVVNHLVNQKQQKFTWTIDSSIPSQIMGDGKCLSQVITNILLNAIKFTPENGEVSFKAVQIGGDDEGDFLQIAIADNGIGMSEEQQKNIFGMFEQIDGGNTRRHGGIGLGLPFSKRIIRMMGGEIWVESELGKGSKFTFTCRMRK